MPHRNTNGSTGQDFRTGSKKTSNGTAKSLNGSTKNGHIQTSTDDIEASLIAGSLKPLFTNPEPAPSSEEIGGHAGRNLHRQRLFNKRSRITRERDARIRKRNATSRLRTDKERRTHRTETNLCLTAVTILVAMCTLNAARFCVNVTESWVSAILFTVVIPATAAGIELYQNRCGINVINVRRILGLIFISSVPVFIISFVNEFGVERGIDDLASMLAGFDYRIMLISQCFVEISITAALLDRCMEFRRRDLNPQANPLWLEQNRWVEQDEQKLEMIELEIESIDEQNAAFHERLNRSRAHQSMLDRIFSR